jgi:hypothetical protein
MSSGLANLAQTPASDAPDRPDGSRSTRNADFGSTLALTVTLAIGCFIVVMASMLLVVHPDLTGLRSFVGIVNQQNQTAKTALYLIGFAGILPLALVAVPRLSDAIARSPNGDALPSLAALLVASLAATLIAVRLSARLPWGDGLGVLLGATALWLLTAGLILLRAGQPTIFSPLRRLPGAERWLVPAAAVLVLATLIALTKRNLDWLPLVIGIAAIVGVAAARTRFWLPAARRRPGILIDVVVILLLLLAIPDTVIFTTSGHIPSSFFEPGIIQFQQDWIIGPANQLTGGGTLLVNSPSSQYGVGMLYFLAGWFHLAPIGYGTFGFLDGVLTALCYAAGYCILRIARVPRLMTASVLALAVVALIYGLHYPVGDLPEQGPLRFGLPMALIVFTLMGLRWPAVARSARACAFAVLGISSIWALENFGYTIVTFAAMAVAQASLQPPGERRRWLLGEVGRGIGVCALAHLAFALATLLASGALPDWGQYLAYLHALLLGGKEGSITYGFERWSPGLAVAAGCLASAAAVVLLVRRLPALARREPVRTVALAGLSAYAIAVFSYADNRSSTYLLLYLGLPLLLAGAMWLSVFLHVARGIPAAARTGAVAFCMALLVLPVAAAWPTVGSRFSRSVLAHSYPGGGLGSALHRLWHPPPIDPRAPEGAALLARFLPGSQAVVLLPRNADLAVEILMRARRTSGLFIGYANMDSFVPSVWKPKIGPEIDRLRAGQRVLIDRTALAMIAYLRTHPSIDVIKNPLDGGASQTEWILQRIDQRFRLAPVYADRDGLVVARLERR